MSSPIHLDEDIDPALMYAPPWAREWVPAEIAGRPAAPLIDVDERNCNPTTLAPEFSGDRAMLELQRQLALNPNLISEPSPEAGSVVWPILIRLCGVISFAAFVAWGIVSYHGMEKPVGIMPAEVSTPAISSDRVHYVDVELARPTMAAPRTEDAATTNVRRSAATITPSPAVPAVVAVAPLPTASVNAIAVTPVPAQTIAPPPAQPVPRPDNRPTVRLDSGELEMLVKRGNEFIANGDLAAARLLLRRGAEAGSAEAALALGATFDPVVMQRLGAIGTTPDITQARQWYQRAAELGSSAASQRLAGLDATR
ncbi:MAG: SEL1-like repeat protein [Xanthobacteraceae bacterium]